MKVIVPAAGFGSRLRPHTYLTPKVLLPVAGKPILEHIIDQAVEWGCDRFTIIHGHLRGQIEAFFERRFDLKVDFRVQEDQLGLGHAVLNGIEPGDEELLIILGDTIIQVDLKPVIERGVTSIGVKEVADPRKLGVVVLKDGRVTRLVEKPKQPPSNLAIVGVYYIRDAQMLRRAIEEIVARGVTVKGEYQITDALQLLVEWGEPVATFPVEGWFDCGKPETLLETNRYLLERSGGAMEGAVTKEAVIIPPVVVGPGTVIERAVVGPYVSLGRDGAVREAVVKNCIIGDRVIIERAMLEGSLVGSRCEVRGQMRSINIGASSCIST